MLIHLDMLNTKEYSISLHISTFVNYMGDPLRQFREIILKGSNIINLFNCF